MIETPELPLAGHVKRHRAADFRDGLGAGSPLLREPAVITDGAELMDEVWRWTPAYLREAIGTVELPATLPEADGRFKYEPGRALDSRPLPVARFLDDMATPDGPRWCLQQVPIRRDLPALAARLDHPSCVPAELINAVNLWMAAPGTVTPLHYDDTHNLFAQVSGTKTFYLFPPEDLESLYPGPINTGAQHLSRINLFHPDLEQHPRVASLSYRTATVSAGEALVLPAFWWHQVASHQDAGPVSISVNFWWRAHVMDCLCPGFMRQLLSSRVQEDVGSLARTFELGEGEPVEAAAELAALLEDIGEHKAASALCTAVLHALRDRPELADRATRLLAAPDLNQVIDLVGGLK